MLIGKKLLITTITLGLSGCASNLSKPDTTTDKQRSTEQNQTYIWLAVGPNNQQIARVVTTAADCPYIQLDNHALQMSQRAKGNQPLDFSQVISCQSDIAKDVQTASINGTKLKLLKPLPQRIAVIGDTGCRMKKGDFQNCNDTAGFGPAWAFAAVAKAVANENPDLIIHLGDYHYRETPCPIGNKGCAGPWGYNWGSWEADFFKPATPLLNAAPWVFSRGNHEDCNRAYKGWFYLLDPNQLPQDPWQKCPDFTPTYRVDLGDFSLIQMDSATLPNSASTDINPVTVKQYGKLFNEVNQLATQSDNNWLLTHRPVWAISSYYDWRNKRNKIGLTDRTMQASLAHSQLGSLADSVKLLLGGHIHNFEALSFTDGRPPLMVIGDGGTKLSPPITQAQAQRKSQILAKLGVADEDFFSATGFAYALLERQPHGTWLIHLTPLNGTKQSFILQEKRIERVWE